MAEPDAHYTDPELAALYDELCRGREDFSFYLPMVLRCTSVLDVGCGTGELLRLARAAGHTGRLVGLDPGAGMLGVARAACGTVEWVAGTLPQALGAAGLGVFDLVVMTGHAFQVLIGDEELHAFFRTVRTLLAPGGRFVFETRNPAARAWEAWDGDRSLAHTPDGAAVREETRLVGVRGELVEFTQTYASEAWPAPRTSRSVLRFLGHDRLDAFLAAAGLSAARRHGDWAGNAYDPAVSREIITVAAIAPAQQPTPAEARD
ncbi:class I SAM-dependent methyltransferase [Actinospica durhamensis]|uniref:Class I SAM-dependent methyltransferase n=1 Tax=Actinospica durhamensis TaxID=1508375 RepID=A0A941EVG3_9ACTN|nr:class I SAM-dependent methyltransferase [Actinospica durhamensis]MBR7838510.1 class I SAM-dependent methyltransferase [Actinospica durhamensis]